MALFFHPPCQATTLGIERFPFVDDVVSGIWFLMGLSIWVWRLITPQAIAPTQPKTANMSAKDTSFGWCIILHLFYSMGESVFSTML